jgi:hypothetical protein
MSANLSPVYVLENWSIAEEPGDVFQAPECRRKFAQGNVSGHPRFEDGEHIYTSTIVRHDYPNRTIYTQNSTYRLGKIDPGYVAYMKENGIEPETLDVREYVGESNG